VCDALVALAPQYFNLPDPNKVPLEIECNPKMFPYFKDCLGALDGTHILATPPSGAANAFRNRKGDLSQNVLSACSFNLKFVYVLAGWEGSAADPTVLMDALMAKGFTIPAGKYYLGDAGYGLKPNCLTPYRGVRYHLREWALVANQRPKDYKELFNLRHAQMRNAVERIFGILKNDFPF
jgi:hypothetical protein